jgi:hypothetical protein
MHPEQKPTWEKPELIVLVRNRPEEAVLVGCKYLDRSAGSPNDHHTGCLSQACGPKCEDTVSS